MSEVWLDAAGHPRSRATLPGFHEGATQHGTAHRADPPTVAESVAVMRPRRHRSVLRATAGAHRGVVARGLRIHEALALAEAGLDPRCGSCACAAARVAPAARSAWKRVVVSGLGAEGEHDPTAPPSKIGLVVVIAVLAIAVLVALRCAGRRAPAARLARRVRAALAVLAR